MDNILLEITMDDNITLHFEELLIDILDFSSNILSSTFNYHKENLAFEEYKEFVAPKEIHIQFRKNSEPLDDFNIDVYVKAGKSIKDWEYADSITEEAFKDGTRFVKKGVM